MQYIWKGEKDTQNARNMQKYINKSNLYNTQW